MRIAKYEFSDGARFQSGAKPDPNVVGASLESLRQQMKGELRAEDVVEAARSSNSPLHSLFEWDDGLAAYQHRLAQARSLIRSVVAIYHRPEEQKPAMSIRAFTHVAEGETSHYRDTHHALSQKATRDAVILRAWRELQSWRQRYKDLRAFADLIEIIDEIGKTLPVEVRRAN